jgi:hypothetical protein
MPAIQAEGRGAEGIAIPEPWRGVGATTRRPVANFPLLPRSMPV